MAYKSNLEQRLKEEEAQREAEAAELEAHPEKQIKTKSTALRYRPETEKRSKYISACFTPAQWRDFSEVNKKLGLTNNAALNMLIAKHINENRMLLEEGWKR